jgi:hypothetical protein
MLAKIALLLRPAFVGCVLQNKISVRYFNLSHILLIQQEVS